MLRAYRIHRRSVGSTIKIGCGQVTAFGDLLKRLKLEDVIKIPSHKNIVYGKTDKYNSPFRLPCGIIKAAEAELGLAVIKDVRIDFQDDTQGADDAV